MTIAVQAKGATGSGVATLTCAFNSPTTAGNLLLCWVIFNHAAITWIISETVGTDTSFQNVIPYNGTSNIFAALYCVPNCNGGNVTFKADSGGTTGALQMIIEEYSGYSGGVDPGNSYVFATGASAANGTMLTSNTLAPTNPNSLLVALLATGTNSGSLTGETWNNGLTVEGSAATSNSAAAKIISAATQPSVTTASSGTVVWLVGGAIFMPQGAAAQAINLAAVSPGIASPF